MIEMSDLNDEKGMAMAIGLFVLILPIAFLFGRGAAAVKFPARG
jgi:hypothetical protein